MGKPVVGEVVVVPFPFSDLTQTKRRPALVIAGLDGSDLILCMITSRDVRDRYAISLDDDDFASGGLQLPSNIRPSRLFTAHEAIIYGSAGVIKAAKLAQVVAAVAAIIRPGPNT